MSIESEVEVDENVDDSETVIVPQNEVDKIADSIQHGMSNNQRELLRLHINLKHLPFSYLKKMAEKGIIPKRLAKVKPPLCVSCLMGKQRRKPWKGQGKKHKSIRKAEHSFPGAMTSTNQMISSFGGLIPQVKGRLTRARYYAAQIKVDHFTDFTYVHLMQDTTAESTLEAKHAYERLMQHHGHKVRGYHADNGRFAETLFIKDAKDNAQQMSFCGVGSHHQNGIAERRIKSLCEDARTMLAHGQQLWPEAVSKVLWPLALKAACRAQNLYNLDNDGWSPAEKLAGVKRNKELKNEHPLFCPVYVLHRKLQGGVGGLPKWDPRSNAWAFA